MTVFKNYFKIVKQFISVIIIYTAIFTFFAVISSTTNTDTTFTAEEPNVAIINNDNSDLINTFTNYIKTNSKIIEIENKQEKIKDALFYREIDYILIIPNNFTKDFFNNQSSEIETMKVPDSYSSTYAEILYNRFWNIASTYKEVGMSEEEISNIILEDLEEKTEVTLIESNQNELIKVGYFYNFTNYTMLAISIFIIGILINIFNDKNIKKRNIISSTSYKSLNIQLFLGNFCITLALWLLYVIFSIILYGHIMFTYNGLLFMINFLIFSITTLSIGFLIGNLVKNKEAQNGIVNILALGSSFICGAFVPQEYLGNLVLSIAKLLPSYWYIKNNNDITSLSIFNFTTISPIIINMIIVLGFAILLFIITNIITKLKLKNN